VIGEAPLRPDLDQVLRYVLGKFGRPTSPIVPEIEAAILDRPRAREIEAEPTFPGLCRPAQALRQIHGR
jgi:oxaloacetate decarboxylase alpha subunit